LIFYSCNYVTIEGLEIINTDSGLRVYDSTYVNLYNIIVHEVLNYCITVSGHYLEVKHSLFYHGVLQGTYQNGWLQCLAVLRTDNPVGLTSHVIIENNTVHSCLGEGIDVTIAEYVTVKNNTVYDCYSVLIYVDNARHVLVDSNLLYAIDSKYNRWDGKAGTAVQYGTESWATPSVVANNITFINNLAFNTGGALGYYGTVNYYENIHVYHNTFYNSSVTYLWPFSDTYQSSGNEIRNNIWYLQDQYSFTIASAISSWKISSNVWLNMSSIPSDAQKANDPNAPKSYVYQNVTSANLWSSSGNPPNIQGTPIPIWFRPGTNSILRGNGATVPSQMLLTPYDFFHFQRKSVPDIGFAEYV